MLVIVCSGRNTSLKYQVPIQEVQSVKSTEWPLLEWYIFLFITGKWLLVTIICDKKDLMVSHILLSFYKTEVIIHEASRGLSHVMHDSGKQFLTLNIHISIWYVIYNIVTYIFIEKPLF